MKASSLRGIDGHRAGGAQGPGDRTTTAYRVQKQLAADIIAGRLAPGSKLGFDMLRARYQVGVSPLREALQSLVAENLVIAEGHVGFTVAPLRIDDLEDINRLRTRLAGDALRDAVSRGDVEWEGRVLAAAHELKRMPIPSDPFGAEADAWEFCHKKFHGTLLSACPSRWLLQFVDILDAQYVRYRRIVYGHYWTHPGRHDVMANEHQAIVDAALRHDADAAVSLLEAHYRRSADGVWEAYRALQRQGVLA